jgi:hypothetical protein
MTMAMLWYLLLAGLAVGMFGAIFTDAALRHRRYMKALEVLRSYADKGIEPPAAVTALLLQPAAESAETAAEKKVVAQATAQSTAQLTQFMTWLFMACVAGGVAWQLVKGGGPKEIAVTAAVTFAVFLGVGALGSFLLALASGLFQQSFLRRSQVDKEE